MPTYNEPIRDYSSVVFKIDPLSVESGVIASGSGVLYPGTVLGRVTASGELAPYDPTDTGAEATGLATAVAVLATTIDATSAAVTTSVIARLAAVNKDLLLWGAAVTTAQHKTDAYGHLKAVYILAQ